MPESVEGQLRGLLPLIIGTLRWNPAQRLGVAADGDDAFAVAIDYGDVPDGIPGQPLRVDAREIRDEGTGRRDADYRFPLSVRHQAVSSGHRHDGGDLLNRARSLAGDRHHDPDRRASFRYQRFAADDDDPVPTLGEKGRWLGGRDVPDEQTLRIEDGDTQLVSQQDVTGCIHLHADDIFEAILLPTDVPIAEPVR